MALLQASNITKTFGIDKIIEDASFIIEEQDKIGLVGLNGAGKSTLIKILVGEIPHDSGDIFISRGTKMGYLAQENLEGFGTIGEALKSIFKEQIETEKKLRQLEISMSKPEIYNDTDKLNSLMEEYSTLSEAFKNQGGYEIQSRIKGVLNGLGFEDESTPISVLSGGQKTRLALARILLKSPDLLFLDEPTNYLDINSIEWLENYLKDYTKAFLVVSHDRYFLDKITTKIFELDNHRISVYNGNYTDYVKQRQTKLILEEKNEELRQKEIERLEKSIQTFRSHRNFIQAESRRKMLENLLPQSISQNSSSPSIKIKFKTNKSSGKEVLKIENLSFAYNNTEIIKSANLKVYRGDRIGIVGPNGIGKSTLLKLIAGELEPKEGKIDFGHQVKAAYFEQEHIELSSDNTILSEVWDVAPALTLTEIRTFLGSFLFSGDEVEKNIDVLSGGEKSRIALAKAILQGANLLLLDEPTNHLDIISKEKLEEALNEFDGTIIAVSHDRYFLSKISTRIWEFSTDGIYDFDGDFDYYVEKKREKEKPQIAEYVETKTQQRKVKYLEKKEREKKKQEQMKLKNLEENILEKEQELEKLEQMLCKPEIYSNPEKAREVNIMYKKVLEELEWLYDSLDEIVDDD